MLYEHDPMLAELRQIKAELWEQSEHDLHKMAQLMTQAAKTVLSEHRRNMDKVERIDRVKRNRP